MGSTFLRNITRTGLLLRQRNIAYGKNINRSFNETHKKEESVHGLVPFITEGVDEFMSYFPLVVEDLTSQRYFNELGEIRSRFVNCLEFTVPNGKRVRGLTTVLTYKMLEKPENLTEENVKLANILGWCAELVEGAVLIWDDIMDSSFTRRNDICWYLKEGVGLKAICDGIALNSSAYLILKKYFSAHPHYIDIIDVFQIVLFKMVLGQTLDSHRYSTKDISLQKFKAISKYKTGFYTFYFPVVLAMYLARRYDKQMVENRIAPILFDMSEYFQVKNDINDCFGNESVSGKKGNDIEEAKCTWLAAKALEKCNPRERVIFEQNYGKADEGAAETIKSIYRKLNIMNEFKLYEKDLFVTLRKRNNELEDPYREVCKNLIDKLENQVYNTY